MANPWWQRLNPFGAKATADGSSTADRLASAQLPDPQALPALEHRSAAAMMRIKNLELRAKVIVEGLMTGLHRSPYHGFSVEFSDYRPYSPGDDLRYLDWKLLARGDRYYIKRYEDETNARCHFLLDLSGSMGYGSSVAATGSAAAGARSAELAIEAGRSPKSRKGLDVYWSKAEYAKTLVAAFAWFLNNQRDAVGLTLFQQQVIDQIPARFRPGQMRRIIAALERGQPAAETNVAAPLDQLLRAVSKRGLIFLISDLLTDVAQWRSGLGYLRSQGHDLQVLRILDPREIDFSFTAPMYFHDLETQREIYIDPELVAADYRQRFEHHAQEVQTVCDQFGVNLLTVTTDQPPEEALLSILQRPSRQGASRFETRAKGNANTPQLSTQPNASGMRGGQ